MYVGHGLEIYEVVAKHLMKIALTNSRYQIAIIGDTQIKISR